MSLREHLKPMPGPAAPEVLAWFDALEPEAQSLLDPARPFLAPLFTAAPYLFGRAQQHEQWLVGAVQGDADAAFEAILAEAAQSVDLQTEEVATELRRAKGRLALLAGIAEVGGAWSTERATQAMSDFADAALETALGALMRDAAAAGKINLPDGIHPAAGCGLTVFALGKHGGRELNYSSDIDIVTFYDPRPGLLAEPDEANKFYSRIVQRLVPLMEEHTALGTIFRTDLRLRPDPGATPMALGVGAALQYYEARGQNWERAAWIKARVCAGDRAVGDAFLAELRPFVWRKHLDFATIDDIQAIKRQINLVRKIGEERLEGHNVKLGRGGIREIEFFTQTQQLIAGGRDIDLRVRPTCTALDRLQAGNWISKQAAEELKQVYWYLRAVENRLQMRKDEQTHTLPETAQGVETIAHMMGDETRTEFEAAYHAATATVKRHYADLFAQTQSLASDIGDLVFTGSEDDPGTLETLYQLGFADPAQASATIRKWHYGGYAATRSAAARAQLTALMPVLLTTISEAGNADEALQRFDHFIGRLPAGVQLFSLLRNHQLLCRMLVLFMASAPRLADEVIHRAHIMDGLIDPTFADDLSRPDALADKVDAFLAEALSYEDLIDRARLIGQEQKFLISAGLVSGTIDAMRAGEQFTTLAQSLLGRVFAAVQTEFAKRHGVVPGARTALLAFGKMASREMTATSDLDFILLYDVPEGVDESDGEKSLAPSHYFARLTQRLLAGLAAPTAAGVLYEADMRLRPSGRAGPLATPLPAFKSYQLTDAWTWEHLALARARVVYAEGGIEADINAIIDDVLSKPRDIDRTVDEVIDMRVRMARDRKPRHSFDLKLVEGGLVDLEFMAQSAQVLAYAQIGLPRASVPQILMRMGELDWIDDAEQIIAIHRTYTTILQVMSTCLRDPFKPEAWTTSFKELLAHLADAPNFDFLEADVEAMQSLVKSVRDAWYAQARRLERKD